MKMQAIRDAVEMALNGLPYLSVTTNDNLCSSVVIHGSYQVKEDWLYGIFHNSPYFIIRIAPKTRDYEEGQEVSIELISRSSYVKKLRKYTGSVDKVIEKLVKWVEENGKG